MTDGPSIEDVRRELDRVVDRLNSMPLGRAESATADVQAAAGVLLAQTRPMDAAIPGEAALPRLGPQGLGAMIAVLGRDWLSAARAAGDADCGPVLDALVALRRALP